MLVRMALLSALKRPKRTALIILAIALSVFVMEFISGWVVGMRDRMRRKILEESAHLIVERTARLDALDPLEPRNYIEDTDAVANHFRLDNRVAKIEKVIPFGALLIAGDKNLPLRIDGIEANTGFFSQVSRGVLRGTFPFVGPGIAISQKALNLVGAPAAQKLVVLVEDVNGAPAYRELPVSCVFRTDDSEFDASSAFTDTDTATDLLGTKGSPELWLRLKNPDEAAEVRDSQLTFLQAQDCVARTWGEMQGSLLVLISISDEFHTHHQYHRPYRSRNGDYQRHPHERFRKAERVRHAPCDRHEKPATGLPGPRGGSRPGRRRSNPWRRACVPRRPVLPASWAIHR